MRLAICDDDVHLCAEMETVLLDINPRFEVDIFYSGEDLCQFMQKNPARHYDILFLDIELENMSGIHVGRFFRDELHDELTKIVYVSGKKGYAMELFDIRPFHFLIKPINREVICQVINKAEELTGQANDMFTYSKGSILHKIPLHEIIYFSSEGHKINIYTTSGTMDFYGKLTEVQEKVNRRFLDIHKSFLVNYDHVVRIQYDEVALSSGTTLPISQQRRSRIRNAILKIERDGLL